MDSFTIVYADLVEIIISSNREIHKCLENLKPLYPHLTENVWEQVYEKLSRNFLPVFTKKWQTAARNKNAFMAKNEQWLKNIFTVETSSVQADMVNCDSNVPGPSKRFHRGRPEKSFDECCDRTKRYKVKRLCESVPEEMIKKAASKVLVQEESSDTIKFTPEKALALLLDASLSKHQYQVLRNAAKSIGCDIFPDYHKVLEAKRQCYPTDIDVTESYACVGLQSLLDHTTRRLFEVMSEDDLTKISVNSKFLHKWGCDGSSGHAEYKQSFIEENVSDSYMFLTSLVPLRLYEKENKSVVYWTNATPSSTRCCRPVQFQFQKETTESTKNEIARMESEIANLDETVISLKGKTYKVYHEFVFTMIDGKIAQTVTDTSSCAVCFICKSKPSEMNNLDQIRNKTVDTEALKVGLSPLHARIKFMECILHIAYNMSFTSWRTNATTKQQKDEEKKRIQSELFQRLGIKVDLVKQGMGTSNDGNTSRRFFNNADIVAEVTRVDKELIHRFGIILQTINSSALVDSDKFGSYCYQTAELYVSLYSWYNMPNTVHKILLHGKEIISVAALPIGMLSEEAQEARNKDYRNYRLGHSRKCSRLSCNEDVMNMLLATSDPLINSLRAVPNKKYYPLHDDAKALLVDGTHI